MKLLVTGGAGFIGSAFIRLLAREHPEHRIVNLDKLTYAGNLENLAAVSGSQNYRFVKATSQTARSCSPSLRRRSPMLSFILRRKAMLIAAFSRPSQ
jgi:dTDP-glucose 4,6-dehydratase